MINSIECCGKVKGYKKSTLSCIKAVKYVVVLVNFHKGRFCWIVHRLLTHVLLESLRHSFFNNFSYKVEVGHRPVVLEFILG